MVDTMPAVGVVAVFDLKVIDGDAAVIGLTLADGDVVLVPHFADTGGSV